MTLFFRQLISKLPLPKKGRKQTKRVFLPSLFLALFAGCFLAVEVKNPTRFGGGLLLSGRGAGVEAQLLGVLVIHPDLHQLPLHVATVQQVPEDHLRFSGRKQRGNRPKRAAKRFRRGRSFSKRAKPAGHRQKGFSSSSGCRRCFVVLFLLPLWCETWPWLGVVAKALWFLRECLPKSLGVKHGHGVLQELSQKKEPTARAFSFWSHQSNSFVL